MQFKKLLAELITISKKSKTDFALAMNMTPSGLSKLLSGSRTPSLKERRLFIRQAAEYFSEALYFPGDYAKLAPIFPVVYNFETREELRRFLETALTHALETALDMDMDTAFDFSTRGRYYLGGDAMLNILCVILSGYIKDGTDKPLRLYVSLPLGSSACRKMVSRMRFMEHANLQGMEMHFFSSPSDLRDSNRQGRLKMIEQVQKKVDLRLHACNEELETFFLIKDTCLLLLHPDMETTPMAIPIFHINQITLFHENLMNKRSLSLTYTADEVVDMLEQGAPYFIKLLEKQLDSIFCFVLVGFLLTAEEMQSTGGSPKACAQMEKIFHLLLHSKVPFRISTQVMSSFGTEGKVRVPFLGTVQIPLAKRAEYLSRLSQPANRVQEKDGNKFYLMESRLSNMLFLFCKRMCIIYCVDDAGKRERLHMLPSRRLTRQILAQVQAQEKTVIRFSYDLWHHYRKRLLEKAESE